MNLPLCAIGDAVLEVFGLNPQQLGYRSEANWPEQAVFDDSPFYQPTGMGRRLITLTLAARPHVMGGLDQYAILKAHHEAQDVVDFIRLGAGLSGLVQGAVAIQALGHEEWKFAPGGIGWRHTVHADLLIVGRRAGGFFR